MLPEPAFDCNLPATSMTSLLWIVIATWRCTPASKRPAHNPPVVYSRTEHGAGTSEISTACISCRFTEHSANAQCSIYSRVHANAQCSCIAAWLELKLEIWIRIACHYPNAAASNCCWTLWERYKVSIRIWPIPYAQFLVVDKNLPDFRMKKNVTAR